MDPRCITLWLRYAEMEMKNRQVNHARNVFDRAVRLLPRCNQFWYKYTYMEEMLGNVPGCRLVFERWMAWQPEEQAWLTYINFEVRYKELDLARAIYTRFITVHPEIKNWIRFAKFEERNGFVSNAREIYEKAVEYFGDENMDENLLLAFAKFEERQKEHERVKAIYKFALEKLPREESQELFKQYTIYEKKYGDREGIEDVVMSKRKFKYEQDLTENPHNYDTWFDYIRLVETEGDIEAIRRIYERAVANIPLKREKRFWRRYIYLWIYYAVFEELTAEDLERAHEVYQFCLRLIPHKYFTFAKFWVMAAKFEIRRKNLQEARKILGTSIGLCPKDKLFREYIQIELQLREFDRCRTLYQKLLEFCPENCSSWLRFAELETALGEYERARKIYEIAISQDRLDMPEVIWKAYIDFEVDQEEFENARTLYERLLERTKHVKVWISFAKFELLASSDETISESNIAQARTIFERANKALTDNEEKEARLMLLEAWQEFEAEHGDERTKQQVESLMPKKVKKRRKITNDDGSDGGWEEYVDYIFPDDDSVKPHMRLLELAKKWKKQITEAPTTTIEPADENRDSSNSSTHREDEEQSED